MADEIVSTAEVESEDEIRIDAVCGTALDLELARERDLVLQYAEREYAFCGRTCRDRFVASPVAYAVAGRAEP